MPRTDVFGPLQGGERKLWRGRCAVAEYAFDKAASLPRWALPETTEVLVTDHRVAYAYTSSASPDDVEVTSGELRWLWPQHLRVQPGSRAPGRAASAAQIQLVCAASDDSFPALVFAGGELATAADADRLANLIRHAIARFRVDNAEKLGLSTPQARMLSRLLIGPEFNNYQGGEGQTVTLLGALTLTRPARSAEPDLTPEPGDGPVGDDGPRPAAASDGTARPRGHRPGLAADDARALRAAEAEAEAQVSEPGLATRAADLAARVADLVSGAPAPAAPAADDTPTTDLAARAANVRRAEARFVANSAKGKAAARRPERGIGSGSRGNRTP
ncbi:translation initiation factor 2 [Actinoplanes sp. NPDC049118]|uniref:translation initiation factor 2 n=1 Tax=Actinoplanes sp. NPDC049118 TaxID=3155769 RepID=UPI0033F04A1E